MFAECETGGTATGERQPLHFEKRNDVLIERAIVFELISEIENHVRLEALHLLLQEIEIVEDREMLGRMTETAQCFEDIRFGLPILGLELSAQILIERRGRDGIEQREDFEFSFHFTISCV